MTWTTRPRSEIGGFAAVATGAGSNVLLLHGVGLCADAWGAQIDALARHFHVTAPDMPGHGQSALHRSDLLIEDYVDNSAEVLNALDGRVCIIGHSMGAMLALELAARFPAKVCGVAALNAVFERNPAAAEAVQARAASLDGTTKADPSTTLDRWFGQAQSPERKACHGWLTSIDPEAYKLAYTAFAHSQSPNRALLRTLQCPALFMTGALEPNSTPAMSFAMAQHTANSQTLVVEGAAHMMPMTHPELVNAALLSFAREASQ